MCSVWTLFCSPRKRKLGVQTLYTALLVLVAVISPAQADCPAAPVADTNDMAISFLADNGVQAASASLLASSVKEGTLVYDDTANALKVCDGSNWIEIGAGTGADTLAGLSCSNGQIAKFNGAAWACAADNEGGTSSGTAGYLQLSGGSGAFASSGASAGQQLFWDTTSHRLGVGTATPAQKLDVVGNATISGTIMVGWERVTGATTANCTAGKVVLGGGCSGTCTNASWQASDGWGGTTTVYYNGPPSGYPSSSTAYTCNCPTIQAGWGGGIVGGGTAYALCARLQ